jgi:hypothetical protein
MTLTLGEIVVIIILGSYGIYLFQALRIRELALLAARRACRDAGVQLLDQTVSIKRLSLSRDQRGRWRVWRQYQFEYSVEGYERELGNVIMLGHQLQGLVMAEPSVHYH